jgi:hypothetical protein
MSTSQLSASEDQEMSDISDPPLMCDSDVVGSPSAGELETIPHVSSLLTQGINSHATALSRLFSMIEYANKPVLVNLAKCHNVQLLSEYNVDILRTLIASHLSVLIQMLIFKDTRVPHIR